MNQGMFDGVIEVPFPDDDYDRRGNKDMFDVYDEYDKPKKNKNKNTKNLPVEVKHEGWTLERANPLPGEKSSWARIGRRPLPFDEKAIVDMVKRHRKQKRTTIQEDFKDLTPNQQGVVTRLLDDRKRDEKSKQADWILYDVQKFGKWGWRSVDIKQIQVILKRVDKNIPLKNGEYVKTASKNQYHEFEIIDLAQPTIANKKKDKKPKKARSMDDLFDPIDDPLSLSMGPLGIVPEPRDHGRNNSHNHINNQMPRDSRQFDQMPPPPPMHPPGGFGLDHNGPGQFQQQPFPQQPFQQPYPTSARQSFSNINPFQPNADVASPIQFEMPPMNDPPWPHPHQNGMERPRTRSQSRDRKMSTRRPSLGVDTGKMRRLEDKIDTLTDITYKMQNWKPMGSDSSEHDNDSTFSYPPSDGHSFTPPSSPRSYFSDNKARGSLERRRSSASRDPRYHPRYRSHRYQDAQIVSAYSSRDNGREYSPEYRRGSKRPSLHHAQTYDDYPTGRAAEPRYLPAAPQPPRPIQRRLTEYGDRDRFENRDYDDRRQGGFRDIQESRRFDDRFDGGRRESTYDSRRRSYVGGAGGGGQYYS